MMETLRPVLTPLLAYSTAQDGNMSFARSPETPHTVLQNRLNLIEKFGLKPKDITVLSATGETNVVHVTLNDAGRGFLNGRDSISADSAITNQPVNIFLLTGDCLPVSMLDSTNKAIGLLHGSRSNLTEIIVRTVDQMQKAFGTDTRDLNVQIGPSIGPCHYREDLWTKAEEIFSYLGVSPNQITNPKTCTFESSDYFSHRQSQVQGLPDDRFATIFGLGQ